MNDYNANFGAPTASSQDDLIVGSGIRPITFGNATIASGQVLTRGALLGQITSGGKLILSLSAASDGSQNPYAILANDVDASGGDVADALIYEGGEFNQNQIIFGTGQTAANTTAALRSRGIYLKSVMAG